MARVSITKAAKLAGVNRGTLYKTYINKGVVSVSADDKGKKYIETSELLRVFGVLQGEQEDGKGNSTMNSAVLLPVTRGDNTKDLEVKMLREQLVKSEQREQWLQSQVDTLSSTLRLLEDKREPVKSNRRWWQVLWR